MRLGDLVFGASGDFGPAIFTAVHVRTGRRCLAGAGPRPRARRSAADGKMMLLDEDGVLALATPTRRG